MKTIAGRPYRYQTLFITIIVMYLVSSLLHDFPKLSLIFSVLFTIIMGAAVYAVSERKIHFVIALGIAVLSLAITWYNSLVTIGISPVLDHSLDVLFFGYIAVLISLDIFHAKEVTTDTVFGAICLYLFLAFIWAFLYAILDIINPSAIDLGPHQSETITYFYYSIVTLTTLGYGEIIPMSALAMTLAALEAVIGPIYLAVLVARFVGILASQKKVE